MCNASVFVGLKTLGKRNTLADHYKYDSAQGRHKLTLCLRNAIISKCPSIPHQHGPSFTPSPSLLVNSGDCSDAIALIAQANRYVAETRRGMEARCPMAITQITRSIRLGCCPMFNTSTGRAKNTHTHIVAGHPCSGPSRGGVMAGSPASKPQANIQAPPPAFTR